MEKIKLINERFITVGVYGYDFEKDVIIGNKTYCKLMTCGTSPQVVYNMLHKAHNEPSNENVMVYYHDKEKGSSDYEIMSLSKAMETFGLYM